MGDSVNIRRALLTKTDKAFSAERESAIAAAGFPAGSYAILMDEAGNFEGIGVKPEYKTITLDELIVLAAARALS